MLTLSKKVLIQNKNKTGESTMGMAASQARYLALTARKTNTEWEGQQINQARTALANQSANLFNRLLNMEVPNAPKTTDYTKLQYSYSDGDNDSVFESWHQINNANSNYNYVVSHYYMADVFTGIKRSLVDPEVQMGDVLNKLEYDTKTTTMEKTDDGNLVVKYKINDYTHEQQYNKLTNAQIEGDEDLKKAFTSYAKYADRVRPDGSLVTDGVFGFKDDENVWHFYVADEFNKITQEQAEADEVLKESITKFETEHGMLNKDGKIDYEGLFGYKDSDSKWHFYSDKFCKGNSIIIAKDYTDYSTKYGPSYVGNSKLTELNHLIVDKNTGLDQATDLAQILKDCPDSPVKNYVHLDDYGNIQYDGKGIYTFDLFGKTYYTTKDDLMESYNNAKNPNTIDDQKKLSYYTASYVSKKIEQTNQALIEKDNSGRFMNVKFDNDSSVYTLNVEEVLNEAAYNDAMNDYLNKKAQYEKTIADINAKTSIIQKEDRTLELRLKQLDTEQNALATEMDAVKKVIKDNVEKTFKTFSD